jgi:hypothetical protein
LGETIAQARSRDEHELEYRCRAALARIDLAQGQTALARQEFLALAAIHPRRSPSWELCLFEAGVAAWLANDRDQARDTWAIIAGDAAAPVANPRANSYIQCLTEFMLRSPNEKRLRAEMARVPEAFQALALWVIAQQEGDPARQAELRQAAAAKGKRHFVWLKED